MRARFFWPLIYLILLAPRCLAQELSIPAFPANLDLSSVEHLYKSAAYKVEVRRVKTRGYQPCFVFETRNEVEMLDFFGKTGADRTKVLTRADEYGGEKSDQRTASFANFDFAHTAVEVRITLLRETDSARSVTIRPLRFGLKGKMSRNRKVITFRLDAPRKISVEINDRLNPLFLFCDAPDVPNPKAKYYFGPGVHRIAGDGTLNLESGDSVYLASNAIVEGRFHLADGSSNISIRGHGILSGGEWPHTATSNAFLRSHAAFSANSTDHFVLEGLTLVNGTGWTVAIENARGATHDNRYLGINMVQWNGNTDGVWMSGTNNRMDNCFFFTNDDAIVSKGSKDTYVSNLVFWGGRWGRLLLIMNFGVDISNLNIENVDVISKEGEQQLIYAQVKRTKPISIRDVTFRNIRVENRYSDTGYNLGSLIRLRSDRFTGSISNWRFENVTLDQQVENEGEIFGSAESPYQGIVFRNLRMGGRLILSPEAGRIKINEHAQVTFLPPSP